MIRFMKSDNFQIFLLGCAALVALLIGTSLGLFIVLRTEWAAILGGLALSGAVFLFQVKGSGFQFLRVTFFVAGLTLAVAGATDLLNFPEVNEDVWSGAMIGFVVSLIFSRILWGSGLHISDRDFRGMLNSGGAFIALLLAITSMALLTVPDFLLNGTHPLIGILLVAVLGLVAHLYHLKRNGSRLTDGAEWIAFIAMLILDALISCAICVENMVSGETAVGVFFLLLAGILYWDWKYVRSTRLKVVKIPQKVQFLTLASFLVPFSILTLCYLLSFVSLEENLSPTDVAATSYLSHAYNQEAFIRLMMRDVYSGRVLENVSMTPKDTSASFMKKLATDQWSFARTEKQVKEWDEGVTLGRGITTLRHAGKTVIAYVDRGFPAAKAGYERGDQVIRSAQNELGQRQIFIQKSSGITAPLTIEPEHHKVDTVSHKIIQQGEASIGYLWLLDFNNDAIPAINLAFKKFKEQGVSEVILDLRYNGGGHTYPLLASLLAGDEHAGQVYFKEENPNKYRDRNRTVVLVHEQQSIKTKRLFVLTTEDTCSASELVINGLRPYLPVITIGDTTCGKPFFMRQIINNGIVYLPISGRMFNTEGQSDYEQGIKPTCQVEETFNHPVDQVGDALLDAALYYQKNNACPSLSITSS